MVPTILLEFKLLPGVLAHTCHSNPWKAEVEEHQISDQPGLPSELKSSDIARSCLKTHNEVNKGNTIIVILFILYT